MKTTIDTEIGLHPSETALICLKCDKKKCFPDNCVRFHREKKRLKKEERTVEEG